MLNICLSTLIKDENRYLEVWIKYYSNYNISKFILFEDKNSKSHQDICNKFGDKVILHQLWDYVTNDDLNNNENGILSIFWKIFYRLYKDSYDAVLIVDPDEFLNCSPEEFIDEANYFKDYEYAVSIKYIWLTKTASGIIRDPYPGQSYSLFDTYKKTLNGYNMPEKLTLDYELRDYNLQGKHLIYLPKIKSIDYFSCPHGSICYVISNFRLNHYLTKSWDEYKFRLFDRGEPIKEYGRKIQDFFVINPDLIPYRDDLIKECESLTYKYNGVE